MRFLLIGGNSTLGKALGDYLSSRGHEIISTTRRNDGAGIFFDLESPSESWSDWPDNIDAAFIASAITKQDECVKYPDRARFINIEQTARLTDQLIRRGTHIIYPSTNIVLACDKPDQTVDAPLSPISVYAETKAEIEKNLYSSPMASIARLPKILDSRSGILKTWHEKLTKDEKIEAFDDLFISPVSLVKAVEFLAVLMEKRPKGVWHLSGVGETSYLELARLLAQEMGKSIDNVSGVPMPPTMVAASPRHPSLDMSKTTENLGILAQTPIEMLRDCFKTPQSLP